jgi:hypothetical protein
LGQIGELCDAVLIDAGEGAAQGGSIRQALEPDHPLHQGIVAVVAYVAKLSVTEEQAHDHQQHQPDKAEDRGEGEVAEAGAQAGLEVEDEKQTMEDDQT